MKADDYIEFRVPVSQGFVHRVRARVIWLHPEGGWGACRPYSVYAYHPEGPEGSGRYLPPATLVQFQQDEARVIRTDELTTSDRPG